MYDSVLKKKDIYDSEHRYKWKTATQYFSNFLFVKNLVLFGVHDVLYQARLLNWSIFFCHC